MLVPVAVILLVAVYFLPFLIADHKKQKNLPVIFTVNLLLGWTLVGWIIAARWAFARSESLPPLENEVAAYSEKSDRAA